ncbi:3-oxoacyl-[acyl-carrier protein] reductase [Asanoa ferruginea]|uniref:3-oxoacyl-[acyl-carrier protein] reductase n=1 Tax=Asanoa ferruginea TaxID=53367 RepID=A0A3D9ZML1_9ACTN|nr:SDR family oxidoreductase [Asanoa ferruginea]REF98109.1 3-oxoacyl-[acyl-carrier protein] reductase [Asanoa ferruginea]GIF49597.1 3-oxoacyl-ACP reductase [Asanoa ferruginea]
MAPTALVTGGSRGIGRAIVERLAAAGNRVVFSYARDKAAADEVVARCPGAIAVRADLASPSFLDDLFADVHDGLDILVNNAAVNPPPTKVADVTGPEFDRAFTANTKVPLLAIGRAAPLMRDGGRIVNISTLNTVVPAAGHVLYCASKAALEQVTAVAARELGPRGITVNTVSPGATDTAFLRAHNTPEGLAQSAALTALGRLGQPHDVAAVVAFLTTPDAGWITGQNIRATGGLLI